MNSVKDRSLLGCKSTSKASQQTIKKHWLSLKNSFRRDRQRSKFNGSADHPYPDVLRYEESAR